MTEAMDEAFPFRELISGYLLARTVNERIDSGLQIDNDEEDSSQHLNGYIPTSPLAESAQPPDGEPLRSPHSARELEEGNCVIRMRGKLEESSKERATCLWVNQSIYKIPGCMRDPGDEKSYIPQIVSLGPYHHGKPGLQDMESHKWRAVLQMLKRTQHDIKLYVNSVKVVEQRARLSYDSPVGMTSDEFVEMMVLDGCFMLEIFRGTIKGFSELGYSRNDPIFSMSPTIHAIRRDVVMLENQIPLFVLEALLAIQRGGPSAGLVAKLALTFLDPLTPTDESLITPDLNNLESLSTNGHSAFDPLRHVQEGFHCLDVLRRSIVGEGKGTMKSTRSWRSWFFSSTLVPDKRKQQMFHSATDLKDAGVKFKRRRTERFWDIEFKNGVLHIPRLLVHDGTKSFFFNLVAFEQCHIDCPNKITSYMIFMDNLIDSPSDVSCLHNAGILEHWLGHDAEIASFFNRLCQEVVFDYKDIYMCKLSENLNTYYDYKWHVWRATLNRKYFHNPWTIISFTIAVFLTLLTVTQTFFSIYSYYKPSSQS